MTCLSSTDIRGSMSGSRCPQALGLDQQINLGLDIFTPSLSMRAPCCIKCCIMDCAQSTFRLCSYPLLKYGFRCQCKHSEFLGSAARHTSTSQKLYHALLSLRSSSPRLGRPSLGKLATALLCSAKIPSTFAVSSGKFGKIRHKPQSTIRILWGIFSQYLLVVIN